MDDQTRETARAQIARMMAPPLNSFADMRRMGEARTNAELQDALAKHAQLREALGLNQVPISPTR